MPANDDLALLCDAARAAGEIGARYFNTDPEVWDKGDNQGPVTEADLAIDRMLKAELRAARPDYGWLSEETDDDLGRLSAQRVFIIDPIDGTRAFIAGQRSWAHSLAIAEHGKVVAAAVFLPMLERLYAASERQSSQLNGSAISASGASRLAGASVLAAKPNFDDARWKNGCPPVERHFRPSLAYRLCLVAEGRFDAMLTMRDCWEWDIAAGALIVNKAGGVCSDIAGRPLVFNSAKGQTGGCIAAGKNLHGLLQSGIRGN